MEHQKPATGPNKKTPSSFVVEHRFDDVDELAEVARSWDLDFRQLHRGVFKGSFLQAGSPSLQLARTRLRGVLHQHGTTPVGLFTFAISVQQRIDLRWRHHDIGRDEILVHHPSSELESTSKTDFEMLLVSVPESVLECAFERAGVTIARHRLADLEIARSARAPIQELRLWIAASLDSAFENPSLLEKFDQGGQNAAVVGDLLARCLMPSLTTDSPRRSTRRRRLVENAVHLARRNAGEIASVEDLCRISGASKRTLRRGFQERFGTTPKAYLQAQRLIGARRQLRATDPSTSISDIANELGFWHLGQFAADYRRQFGELPSQTVRRATT